MIAAITVAVFALALAALAYPLVRRPRVAPALDLALLLERDAVEEREAALSALGELDFDHAVGKLAEEDYRVLRDRYERQALALLKATDPERLAGDAAGAPGRTDAGRPAPLAEIPPPRLDPVLGEGTIVLRPAPLPAASPVAAYRNGKDHALHGAPGEAAPPRPLAPPPATAGGGRLALGTAAAAALFAVGVGAVYYTGSRSQGEQRAVATLVGVGPRGLALVPAGRAFLASAGGLWTSADAGGTWQPLGGLDSALRAVAVSAARPSRAYAVGPGLVARSDDGGQSWVQQRAVLGELLPRPAAAGDAAGAPADLRALAVDPAATERLWTVVEGVGLIRSDDGGQSWAPGAAGVAPNATALVAVADAAQGDGRPWLFLASATEGVLASADAGASWAPASGVLNGALPSRRVTSLAFDADSGETAATPDGRTLHGTLYAGTEQGLFKSLDRGQSWGRLPLAASVAAVGAVGGESPVVVAVDRDGKVYRSRDRGVTWDAK